MLKGVVAPRAERPSGGKPSEGACDERKWKKERKGARLAYISHAVSRKCSDVIVGLVRNVGHAQDSLNMSPLSSSSGSPLSNNAFIAARKTDRPQSEFTETLAGDKSDGLTLSHVWWASWVQKWSFEQTTRETRPEIKLDCVRSDGLCFTVRGHKIWGRPHSLIRLLCSEIQGHDCVRPVCCNGNIRRHRHVWCPVRNVGHASRKFSTINLISLHRDHLLTR